MIKNLTILLKKSSATEKAFRTPSLTNQGINLLYLVNLSTQAKIVLCLLQRGRSVMKSIVQDMKLPFGTGNGYHKPGWDSVEDF